MSLQPCEALRQSWGWWEISNNYPLQRVWHLDNQTHITHYITMPACLRIYLFPCLPCSMPIFLHDILQGRAKPCYAFADGIR